MSASFPTDIEVKITTWHDPDGAALRSRQRDEILATYPGEPGLPPSADDVPVFMLLKISGAPVAGAGLRPLPNEDDLSRAEIKRMYVVPEWRGTQKGIADLLMQRLEGEAVERGFGVLRLETGTDMLYARRFYERHGYTPIPLYGQYIRSTWSTCYEKHPKFVYLRWTVVCHTNMTVFAIRAVFDINCPWCYIGHTYLARAVAARKAQHPDDRFNISLIPFYLKPPPQESNPSAPLFPVPTESRQKLREDTYGNQYADSVLNNIKHASKVAGLHLKFNGPTGTTRNGHRLVQHAQKVGSFESAEGTLLALFKLYHEEETDITQVSVLTDVGVENGLGSKDEVEQYLLSGEDGKLVDGMAAEAREEHAGGVPWFEVCNERNPVRQQISGAQSDRFWENLFQSIA